MKTYILKLRATDNETFANLKTGRKVIETRAGSKRYRNIVAGDNLIFVCGKERATKTVKQVHYFKTIGALLKALPLIKIMPDAKSVTEARRRWNSYPGYKERLKNFGIIAWELK